jgi:hypothetical protein
MGVPTNLLRSGNAPLYYFLVATIIDELSGKNASVTIGDCTSQLLSYSYGILFQLTSYLECAVFLVVLTVLHNVGHFASI